jgi:hypothetical protein
MLISACMEYYWFGVCDLVCKFDEDFAFVSLDTKCFVVLAA